jgi:hypothetical protein
MENCQSKDWGCIRSSGEKPAADVKGKKTGERSRAGHHILREAMTSCRERAIKMGFKMGTCFICCKDHLAHLCPDYSEKSSAPRIEDAHVTRARREVGKLDK